MQRSPFTHKATIKLLASLEKLMSAGFVGRRVSRAAAACEGEHRPERRPRRQLPALRIKTLSQNSGNFLPEHMSQAVKVMHAARQDLEVLLPAVGLVKPVFDTQIAAALAGHPSQVGYGELTRRLIGVELPKAHTRADWSRRPLEGGT